MTFIHTVIEIYLPREVSGMAPISRETTWMIFSKMDVVYTGCHRLFLYSTKERLRWGNRRFCTRFYDLRIRRRRV